VDRERKAQITVIIGNPPYNAGQLNENDNNKNRKYPVIDRRIHDTYAKDSKATNKNALSDAYVKFFRWATDRLDGRDGIVCFVSNNSFVDQIAFDGMRKHLMQDLTQIDHIDLHGNVRKNPKLSGTTHNVFGIQVGVGITVAVRCEGQKRLRYHRVAELWRKEEKLASLDVGDVSWRQLAPREGGPWLSPEHTEEFGRQEPLAVMFRTHTVGVKTNRDDVVYGFHRDGLGARVAGFVEAYNSEVDRYRRSGSPASVDDWVSYERVKWSDTLKLNMQRGVHADFDESRIRPSLYRPFSKKFLYFDPLLNERLYSNQAVFPSANTYNLAVCCTNHTQMPFVVQMAGCVPNEAPGGRQGQCFPFYTYNPDGSNRRENITDAAISKWDIFHYIYAVLHHPAYREKFADNLKRELPRIPFAPDFAAFAAAGRELAHLHVDYETLEPWPLEWIENPAVPQSYSVEDKMRLNKDKTALTVNPSLTLAGIPPETFEYRLGNRSALEWVVDQYRVTEDDRSGIKSDPNREDDPQYIVRLVGQVVRVSIETVRIVRSLPRVFPG
jgi:predicted helicase